MVVLALSITFLGWWGGILYHPTAPPPPICETPDGFPYTPVCYSPSGEGTICWSRLVNNTTYTKNCHDYNFRPWWETPLSYAGGAVVLSGAALFAYSGWRLRADKLVLGLLLAGTAFLAFLAYILPRFFLDATAVVAALALVAVTGPPAARWLSRRRARAALAHQSRRR
jgi:hypothetical protein